MMNTEPEAPGLILYGTKAIGEFLGIGRRQAQHLVEAGRLPHFRVGKIVSARRSTLLAWIAEQEAKSQKVAA